MTLFRSLQQIKCLEDYAMKNTLHQHTNNTDFEVLLRDKPIQLVFKLYLFYFTIHKDVLQR